MKKEHFQPAILFAQNNQKDVVAKYDVFTVLTCIIHGSKDAKLDFKSNEWAS
jgi:hypothetical protein